MVAQGLKSGRSQVDVRRVIVASLALVLDLHLDAVTVGCNYGVLCAADGRFIGVRPATKLGVPACTQ